MERRITDVSPPTQDSRPRRSRHRRNRSAVRPSKTSNSTTAPPFTRLKRPAIKDRVFALPSRATTSWLEITPEPVKPFNFLGLPKEVRLMIYELLPEEVTHRFVVDDCIVEVSDKCCDPAILLTCKSIFDESHQLLFNLLRHDGPRLHLSFRGLNVSQVLQICDIVQPSRPIESRHFRDPDDAIGQEIISKAPPFDIKLFELRSYMRTPKDYEAHIDWIPWRYSGMTEREFLGRFVWDLGRLYCIIANHDYTVSVWDGNCLVPLQVFVDRRIPRGFGGIEFHHKLAVDRFASWRDIICRPAGRRATAYWLWKSS